MSVLQLFESVLGSRVSSLDAQAIRHQFSVLARVRAWIDSREAELTARLIDLSPGGSVATAALDVSDTSRKTKRQARQLVDRATALQDLPELGQALSDGRVTAAHVDEVVSALKKAGDAAEDLKSHEGALVLSAARLPHDQFSRQVAGLLARLTATDANDRTDRQVRGTYLKSWTDDEGMIHIRGAFDAERGSVLLGRLENRMEQLFHAGQARDERDLIGVTPNDNLRAEALLDMCGHGPAEGAHPSTAVRAEIVVLIDLETLQTGLHQDTTCRTSMGADLPVDSVRRLACQADIIPAVLNGSGVPIDVGRQNRLATARQRRLIFAMYRTCAVPECGVPVHHCAPHHITYWENGGRTDLSNLVPLCSRHHHAAHEGGWRLRLDDERTLHVTLPDGREMSRPLDRQVMRT